MPNKINLTGTAGHVYDLDEMEAGSQKASRSNSSRELVVQVWKWNPNLPAPHNVANPENPAIGQIWLSKFVKEGSTEYNEMLKGGE